MFTRDKKKLYQKLHLLRKTKYEAVMEINLMKGLSISLAVSEPGAMRATMLLTGKLAANFATVIACVMIPLRRKPGSPSYHLAESICCTFG